MYQTRVTKQQVGKHTSQVIISTEKHKTIKEALMAFLKKLEITKTEIEERQVQTANIELFDETHDNYLVKNLGNVPCD